MSALRKALNQIAHKRAREVARKKRVQDTKEGKAIPAQFARSGGRQ